MGRKKEQQWGHLAVLLWVDLTEASLVDLKGEMRDQTKGLHWVSSKGQPYGHHLAKQKALQMGRKKEQQWGHRAVMQWVK